MPDNAATIARTVLCAVMVATVGCGGAHAGDSAGPVWPTRQWQTSTPEAQGMDSAVLAGLIDYGTTRRFDSLLIARHGRIVLDAYYTADFPHVANSTTKAVIGTLTAIATQEGLLDGPNHPMLDFFGDRHIANLDDRKRAITIQNVLDMTSGIEWEEGIEGSRKQSLVDFGRSANQIQFVLDRPMAHVPGDVFNYNSGNPNLLSAIITRLTGMTAWDYAKAKLFAPLGISTSRWWHDAQGLTTGGGGLVLYPRDMAKIGYLYLRQGKWEDRQLIPPDWADRPNHAAVNMNASFDPDLRYSNFFWAFPDKHVFMAVGDRCQLIMVFPKLDIVAVTTSRNYCSFSKMANDISATVKSDVALPPNPAGAALLADKIRDISTEKPTEVGETSAIASAISGKTYQFPGIGLNVFPGNGLNLKSLSLDLADAHPHYELEVCSRDSVNSSWKFAGPIGLDGRYRLGEATALGVIALKGAWSNSQTFAIDVRLLGGDNDRRWILSFDGAKVNLRGKDVDGREVSIDGEIAGSN
jgi:CubicO group peptidase (beta-lactamase class C family)